MFDDARIARVRITSGNVAPGPDDDAIHDIVVMDDFIYGEPQPDDGHRGTGRLTCDRMTTPHRGTNRIRTLWVIVMQRL